MSIQRNLEEYLKTNAPAEGIDTIQKLQSQCGIKLRMTSKEDHFGLKCFVQYRVAFYVAGKEEALVNFFLFLDGFLEFKAKQYARANPFEVVIHPYDQIIFGSLSLSLSLSFSLSLFFALVRFRTRQK